MKRYDYLIVGGGMTAAAAIKGIRELDSTGSICLVGAEVDPPYDKPPLSKSLWKGKSLDDIWMDCGNAEMRLGSAARALRPSQRILACEDGSELEYGSLLIATGSRARRLGLAEDPFIYLREIQDYRRIRAISAPGKRALVLGGGFIGMEMAAALAMNGLKVSLLFPEKGLGWRLFPSELSLFLDEYYVGRGVELFPETGVLSLEELVGAEGRSWIARTSSGRELAADLLVAGIGTVPNVELAASARLEMDEGLAVDSALRTSEAGIFAAGDVASFHCEALGRRIRVEHEDNALSMGLAAGRSMAGAREAYDRIPYFYSDLFELGYEAAGELDSRLETFMDWKQPFEKGLVYYLKDGRVRGVLLWNIWRKVEAARALIALAGPLTRAELAGKI